MKEVATVVGNRDVKIGCMLETPRICPVRIPIRGHRKMKDRSRENPAVKRTISREVLWS